MTEQNLEQEAASSNNLHPHLATHFLYLLKKEKFNVGVPAEPEKDWDGPFQNLF